jgi:hypothetical protein
MIEDDELYHMQAEAEMEVDSDRGGAHSVQEYFQNDDAMFMIEEQRP